MTLFLPAGRDRRRDKNRRIATGYGSLAVTLATRALVQELVATIGAVSVDEALFYVATNQLGFQRAAEIIAAVQRPAGAPDRARCTPTRGHA